MSLFCKLQSHKPSSEHVWNDGWYFSSCSSCGCVLVRRPQGKWKRVPRGYKVASKPRPPGVPKWDEYKPVKSDGRSFSLRPEAPRQHPSISQLLFEGAPHERMTRDFGDNLDTVAN